VVDFPAKNLLLFLSIASLWVIVQVSVNVCCLLFAAKERVSKHGLSTTLLSSVEAKSRGILWV
jgi:hypothetical protein